MLLDTSTERPSGFVALLQDMKPERKSEYLVLVLHTLMLEEEFILDSLINELFKENDEGFCLTYKIKSINKTKVLLQLYNTEDQCHIKAMSSSKTKHCVKMNVLMSKYIQDDVSNSTRHLRIQNINELSRLFKDKIVSPLLFKMKNSEGLPAGKESLNFLNDDCLVKVFGAVACPVTLSRLSQVSKRFLHINEDNGNKRMLWKDLIKNDFAYQFNNTKEEVDGQKYKDLYKMLFKIYKTIKHQTFYGIPLSHFQRNLGFPTIVE